MPSWPVLAVLLGGAAAIAVALAGPPGAPLEGATFALPLLAAAMATLHRVVRVPAGAAGPARILVTGLGLYIAGCVVVYAAPLGFGRPPAFPSVADALFVAAYGMFAWFLLVALGRRQGEERVRSLVAMADALIVASAGAAPVAVLLVAPNLRDGTPDVAAAAAMAYPVVCLVLFGLAVRLALTCGFRSLPETLLVLWTGGELVAVTAYGHGSANGVFEPTSWGTAAWMLGYTALAAAMVHPALPEMLRRPQEAPERDAAAPPARQLAVRLLRLTPLFLSALVPLGLAVEHGEDRLALMGIAACTFALVLFRVSVVAGDRDVQRDLADRLSTIARESEQRQKTLSEQRDQLAGMTAELTRIALHDSLTGLPNRVLLEERLERALADARRRGGCCTLLLLDLDRFKEVNDSLGHPAGDELLRVMGRRLAGLIRTTDTVARLGGDEFGILLADAGIDDCGPVVDRLLSTVGQPMRLGASNVRVTASVGIVDSRHAGSPVELLRNADLSMYRAKETGGEAAVHFEPQMHAALVERLDFEVDLRRALDGSEFVMHYQPIVSAPDGRVRSVEALIRWSHPRRGILPPGLFIPVAERAGLIQALGEWVLDESCRQLSAWRREDGVGPDVSVAVNVSPAQMADPAFAARVRSALRRHGLTAADLTLEVTESLFAEDEGNGSAVLHGLREDGVDIAMDDFGTGFSSLSRLSALPIDRLKIDRSFVSQIRRTSGGNPLTATIVSMGHALGLVVVAEGVETDEQLTALRRLGCDFVQGFLLSRPVPAEQVPGLVAQPFALDARPRVGAVGASETESELAALAAKVVSAGQTLDALAPEVLAELRKILGMDVVYLTVRDASGGARILHATGQGPRAAVAPSEALTRRALSDGHRYLRDVTATYPDSDAAVASGVRSFVNVPIHAPGGAVLGAVSAASATVRDVPRSVLTMVELFARTLGERLHEVPVATGRFRPRRGGPVRSRPPESGR